MGAARTAFPATVSSVTGVMSQTEGCGLAGRCVPWAAPASWERIQAALHFGLEQGGIHLTTARRHAAAVAHTRDRLADLFDHLAATTCAVCADPCCGHAKVWLDYKDLLFIHLNGEVSPPRQLRRELADPCRYLGPHGCLLPHRSRPWICAWYICPSLREALERDLPGGWRQAVALRNRVKVGRATMAAAFRAALDGKGWRRDSGKA